MKLFLSFQKHIHPEYEFLNTVTKDDLEIPENIHQQLIECTDGIDKVNVSSGIIWYYEATQ